jgi:hypothetical protein
MKSLRWICQEFDPQCEAGAWKALLRSRRPQNYSAVLRKDFQSDSELGFPFSACGKTLEPGFDGGSGITRTTIRTAIVFVAAEPDALGCRDLFRPLNLAGRLCTVLPAVLFCMG